MKRVLIVLIVCMLGGIVLSSCMSSKPCPAYQSVSTVEQPVEKFSG
ncbi:MAG: hypothetical protein LBS09_07705 [Bacteroidales bacterium]|jgi:hypothetical protein|nr:hypothetical protein [Bacteroidales bacterium]